MKCEKCGHEIIEGSLVCDYCGKAVPRNKLNKETISKIENKDRNDESLQPNVAISIRGLGILLIVIGILCDVVCMFLVGSGSFESFHAFTIGGTISFLLGIAAAAAVVVIAVGATVAVPKIQANNAINSINESFDSQNYADVVDKETDLELVSDEATLADLNDKLLYSKGKVAFENKEYDKAIEYFNGVSTIDTKSDINEAFYELGKKELNNKNPNKALEYLEKVTGKDDVPGLITEAKYNSAITLFEKGSYEEAKTQFEATNGYGDSASYITMCNMGLAEALLSQNKYDEAKNAYNAIPDDTTLKNINAGMRKAQLNKYMSLLKSQGKIKAKSTYAESKQVWKENTGYTDYWYIDKVDDEYVEYSIKLNDDGTFTMTGRATFYRFTNYSSVSRLCQAKGSSVSFKFENITSIPSNLYTDSDTTLTYSGGKFSLKYYVYDDYSTNFYHIYRTNVTY